MLTSKFKRTVLVTGLAMALIGAAAMVRFPGETATHSMIVQGSDLAAVRSAVVAVGGEITHELGIIDAVGATLTAAQIDALNHNQGVTRVYGDAEVQVAETK